MAIELSRIRARGRSTDCEYDQRQNGALPSVRDVITHALHFQNLLSGSEKVSKFKKPAQILVANFYFLDLKKRPTSRPAQMKAPHFAFDRTHSR